MLIEHIKLGELFWIVKLHLTTKKEKMSLNKKKLYKRYLFLAFSYKTFVNVQKKTVLLLNESNSQKHLDNRDKARNRMRLLKYDLK